jgi:YHS domain-containing protein
MSFIFRVVEILIAISVIRSFVNFARRLWYGFRSGQSSIRPPARPQPADTMLQQDPVCGTYVSVETSLKKLTGGRVYHFCSPECRNRFSA